jgi:aspartyl-tRNA(Asn)/glutamyl-tRNA(Gln) amidotransferase subunit C
MSIDITVVRRVAQLAKLDVPEPAESLLHDMNRILGLIDELAKVSVDGVSPLVHPEDPVAPLREDVAEAARDSELLQAGAPHASAGFFLVPKVIE